MKLERVDIFGFKSFGDKAELSFHQGVTAIVGPNGCGKSNISDAIGWVLGEQSAKSMRGRKMEDFIFTGSVSRPPVSVAEVNLRLSDVNGDPTLGKRQVVVTRRLYRSGESEYLMDGSPCRLRDIHEVFMDTGVGNKAYSIIEQGKIGLILSSRPSDRRGVIEEAAGITKYKARRRSAALKLQAAQQNLLRVNDIVYEIERQMSSLKRQAGKARRYRRLRDSMSHLEKIAAVKKSRELDVLLERLRKKLRSVGDEEIRRATSLSVAENHLERLRLERADRESDLSAARDRLHQIEITIERLETQIATNRQQTADLENRRGQLVADLSELTDRHGPSVAQLELRVEDEKTVTEELSRSEETASRSQQEMSRASLELAEAEKEIEEGRGELVHRISKIAALKNFLEGVMAQSEKVATEILKLKEEARELETEHQKLDESKRSLLDELSRRKGEAERLATERETLEIGLKELSTEFGQVESELGRRREELSELTGRLASLEELVDARAHFGAGARHLLTAGDSLNIPLSGSVADSIEVDPRFERATERFLGDWLQRIVVETEQDALAAQAHLEEENVGRCDFLVESLVNAGTASRTRESLEALRGKEIGGIIGPLRDRVRWTNGKGDLLERVLPDAIVVETMETALQAFRSAPQTSYVTLAGDVIEPPGVLRVGPGGPSEGLLSTRREIRELKENSSLATEALESLGERRKRLESELESHRLRLATVLEEQHDLDKEMVGLEHQSRQLEEELGRARRKAEVLGSEQSRSESERSSLSDKRIEMEQSLTMEEESKSLVESKLDELRSSLSDRRALVESLQSKTSKEASQVAALRERAQAVRFDVERLREGVQELERRMAMARREKQELAEKDERLKRELASATAETNELLRKRDGARVEHSVLDGRLIGLRQRGEVTEAALKSRRRELEVVRDSRSSEEVALAREESEMNHLRTSFENAHGICVEEAAAVTSPSDLARDEENLTEELENLRQKLDSIGPVNPMADEEYRELETRHEFLTTQRQDLLDSISSTETAIRRIDTTSRRRFQEAFEEINRHFDVTFKQLFGGGRAGLSLTDEEDILESGVDINAQPPGKRLQNVLLLSGGEKALTAIALMFAVFRYKPSPFCLLDEVDAPLDDANVSRFISMLGDLRKSTQFIIITHNRKTMEIADQMYGVTMEEPGISKLVSVKLVSDEAVASGVRPS